LTAARYGRWAEASGALRAALGASDVYTEADQDLLPNLGIAALHLQDDDVALRLHTLLLTRARDTGATIIVLYALVRRVCSEIATGRWSDATTGTAEALALARATGQPGLAALPLAWTALLAALHGRNVQPHLDQAEQIAAEHPLGTLTGLVHDVQLWTRAHTDPPNALHHLEGMTLPVAKQLAALDRVEAAVRAGRSDLATAWADELATFAEGTGAAWASAAAAHSRALLAVDPAEAERHFAEALAHHGRSPRRVDAARTHLAFGEHLRRARRRVDARTHLRAALAVFDDLGAAGWAERARTELRASGETARRRDADTDTSVLTPQELQVATLVARGLPNRDAAAQLFVSPRTIEFHLRNIFGKLGITSRAELARIRLAA
jgi:DNA-binding CsgD family transcriptional regulator